MTETGKQSCGPSCGKRSGYPWQRVTGTVHPQRSVHSLFIAASAGRPMYSVPPRVQMHQATCICCARQARAAFGQAFICAQSRRRQRSCFSMWSPCTAGRQADGAKSAFSILRHAYYVGKPEQKQTGLRQNYPGKRNNNREKRFDSGKF